MDNVSTLSVTTDRHLTAKVFHALANVPPELEWFANLGNKPHLTVARNRVTRRLPDAIYKMVLEYSAALEF